MQYKESSNKHFDFDRLVAIEKLQHMHMYSKSSTIATVLAPLLCIPLYFKNTEFLKFALWFSLMVTAVLSRYFLLESIKPDSGSRRDFMRLNMAIGMVTLVWGIGWFFFVHPADAVSYLMYEIISLTVLFFGMVGYCINWKTFFSFIFPLKLPELIFILLHHNAIVWPVPLGSMVAFYFALKMGFLFSQSWEKSFSLGLKNDALFNQVLEEKNASLAANIAKSEFIATASHDLRQPMQSINIFIDMIDPTELKEHHGSIFARMRKSVSVLNRMFNTLLDISKLDSYFAINEQYFSSKDIVKNLEDSFADLCHEKGIFLKFHQEDFIVKGDADLTEQILRNLLSNAIQYTDKGLILISITAKSGLLHLSVEDSGCGIPPEDIPYIFKEFYRSEHSRSQHDGLGLGLSIVNRIVKKIKGECTVESEVGKGSTFSIQTSFSTVPNTESITAKAASVSHGDSGINALYEAATDEKAKPHLGILENDRDLQFAYEQYFTNAGYAVHLIPYKDDLFEQHLEIMPKPDFILSDYRLQERDGIYFIQKLREEFNHDIPACIVTADTSPKHLELFSRNNIDVMYKPIDIKAIDAFILKKINQT